MAWANSRNSELGVKVDLKDSIINQLTGILSGFQGRIVVLQDQDVLFICLKCTAKQLIAFKCLSAI